MAKIAIIDGPEKAGKSSVAASFIMLAERSGYKARIRKQNGPATPSDVVYLVDLIEDTIDKDFDFVLWDRGWPSEYVYGSLMKQRPMSLFPTEPESNYTRMVTTQWILLGPDVATLSRLRDETDLPVSAADERRLFAEYGRRFGWNVVSNPHLSGADRSLAAAILKDLTLDNTPYGVYRQWKGEPDIIFMSTSFNSRLGPPHYGPAYHEIFTMFRGHKNHFCLTYDGFDYGYAKHMQTTIICLDSATYHACKPIYKGSRTNVIRLYPLDAEDGLTARETEFIRLMVGRGLQSYVPIIADAVDMAGQMGVDGLFGEEGMPDED